MKKINYSFQVSILTPKIRILICFAFITGLTSCESFLEIELPSSKVSSELVFSDDITATSAVNGLYHDMLDASNFASGSQQSVTSLAGLSADELWNYQETSGIVDFEENILSPQNGFVFTLWSSMYKIIYEANSIIEGITASNTLSAETKDQLLGEAIFVRAFVHFYLTNLFGEVPLVITSDYRSNSTIQKSPVSEVYEQIKVDLIRAQTLLGEDYPTLDDDFFTRARVRPNKSTATALLARVYLYLSEWQNAETEASKIIDNTSLYSLVDDLNQVFLKNSNEAIWQLRPVAPGYNTNEGSVFIINGIIQFNLLTDEFMNAFEVEDQRMADWIAEYETESGTVYYPYKYKVQQSATLTEYSMVLRLAEQYLIRAEARAQNNDLAGSISDVDKIRARANLPLILDINPSISQEDLLVVIEHERQIELFTEWGHRWLDLKRYDHADAVLSPIKAEWNTDDVLYPLPQSELNKNPHLGIQNEGY